MLTKVEAFSAQPNVPILSLGAFSPHQDLIQLMDIDGLGPVKANIETNAAQNYEIYVGSSRGKRNILLKLGPNPYGPVQTMSSLRALLYKYFLTQAWCKLRFFSDDKETVEIEGYVESFEPNIFSKDPEVQISIICPEPDFVAVNPTVVTGEVKAQVSRVPIEVEYAGDVPTGFVVEVRSSAKLASYTGTIWVYTYQLPEGQKFTSVSSVTVDGSKYYSKSSNHGKKHVQSVNVSSGARTSLLKNMSSTSSWLVLKPGKNEFAVTANTVGQDWTLTYFNRYGGL